VGNNNFDPDGKLTREQAATMLSRLADVIGKQFPENETKFDDKDIISEYAVQAVGGAEAAGIMNGTGDNKFSPKGAYTREQSIITILRMYDFLNSVG